MATDLGSCHEPRSVPSLCSGFGWLTGRQVEVEREQLGEGTLGTPRRVFRTRILSKLSPLCDLCSSSTVAGSAAAGCVGRRTWHRLFRNCALMLHTRYGKCQVELICYGIGIPPDPADH